MQKVTKEIVVVTFRPEGENSPNKIRVYPMRGQGYSEDLRVAFSLDIRYSRPAGTLFKITMTEVRRSNGSLSHLCAWKMETWKELTFAEAKAFISESFGNGK